MTASEHQTATASTKTAAAQPNTAKIASALLRYRVLAWTTGLWLLLLTGEMIAKYGFGVHTPNWIAVVHGWVYFVYLLTAADLSVKVRWPIMRTVGTLIAGTIPLLSFFVEHWNAAKVKRDFNL
ncbi:DUF3817 domain-containing protein [Nocardia arthritidis]|uniref:DUF3817 domain-containing protein n=1 Tax=Nocardia arthritidis TaxID=228602 RepID=UPI00142D2173